MDERARRIAENEMLFRGVNARIQRLGRRGGEAQRSLCECGENGCEERIAPAAAEYVIHKTA